MPNEKDEIVELTEREVRALDLERLLPETRWFRRGGTLFCWEQPGDPPADPTHASLDLALARPTGRTMGLIERGGRGVERAWAVSAPKVVGQLRVLHDAVDGSPGVRLRDACCAGSHRVVQFGSGSPRA